MTYSQRGRARQRGAQPRGGAFPRPPAEQRKPSLMADAYDDPDGRWARREQMPKQPRTDVPAGTEVRIRFAPPAEVATENEAGNWHWSRRAEFRQAWRHAACAAAVAHAAQLEPIRGCRVEVTVALPWKGRSARVDPANLRATTKPVLDGVTDSQTVFPDDNARWVTEREPLPWQGDAVVIRFVVVDPNATDWDPAE